jgi:cysteinyl-tRNA synthetase
MASSILGKKMDIHSGGIDLIFPHHENELSQAEAYYDEADWAKYWIHVGHLHIKGLKMSKSLKNFITIKDLIKIVPARVIKLYFFLHRYDVILNYDPETSLKEAG